MTELKACPICEGQGTVSKPPYLDGDIHTWVDSRAGGYTCKVCNGEGYIRLE